MLPTASNFHKKNRPFLGSGSSSHRIDLSKDFGAEFRRKLGEVTLNQEDRNESRQNPLEVDSEGGVVRNLVALTGIHFGKELFLTPTIAARAEDGDEHATSREHGVAHDKVFEVQNAAAGAERFKARKHVKAEGTGERKQEYDQDVPIGDLAALESLEVHPERHQVFENGNQGRHGRKRHEQEECGTEEPARRHHGEHVRKRHEDKARTLTRRLVEGKAARDDDDARDQGDDGIQNADTCGFFGQGMILSDVATENSHATDTEAQGKEGVRKGGKDSLAQALARLRKAFQRRQQVEFETSRRTGERHGANRKNHHNDKQANHHDLGDAFHTLLEAKRHDKEADDNGNRHPENHEARIRKHFAEAGRNLIRSAQEELGIGHHLVEVVEHPASHHRVEGH